MSKTGSGVKILSFYSYAQCCMWTVGTITLIAGSLANFAVPALIGAVIDSMLKKDWDEIDRLCLGMMILVLVSGIAVMIRGATFNTLSEKIAQYLRYDLFFFLINKDISFFDENKTGEILSRISSDTSVVQDGLSTNFSMFFRAMIIIVLSIVILCYISWKLTLVTLSSILPISMVGVCYSKIVRELAKQTQEKKSDLGQVAEEALSNVRTVKAFACEPEEIKKYIK